MGHWPTLSKLVFFDVGSGAIRWGGDWHEGVDERKVRRFSRSRQTERDRASGWRFDPLSDSRQYADSRSITPHFPYQLCRACRNQ